MSFSRSSSSRDARSDTPLRNNRKSRIKKIEKNKKIKNFLIFLGGVSYLELLEQPERLRFDRYYWNFFI